MVARFKYKKRKNVKTEPMASYAIPFYMQCLHVAYYWPKIVLHQTKLASH